MHLLDLKKLPDRERNLLYHALLHMVKSNTGHGFRGDQRHLAYSRGAAGDPSNRRDGDSPAENVLYQMMKALAETIDEGGDFAPDELVRDWQTFCKLAVAEAE